jgi:hypothetical protein
MTSEYDFETIPFAAESGLGFEQEWSAAENEEEWAGEEENERGRFPGRARGRRPRPVRRPRRPSFGRPGAAAVLPTWLAAPDVPFASPEPAFPPADAAVEPAAASFEPGEPVEPASDPPSEEFGWTRCASGSCPCAACRQGAARENEWWSGERQEVAFEALEFAPPFEREAGSRPGPSAPGSAACSIKFVDCPSGGTPSVVLGGFKFDQSALMPPHIPLLRALARRIVASQGTSRPIRSMLIAGHTDAAGDDNYNFGLARRRAETVGRELCGTIERLRPGGTRGFSLNLTSCGERQTRGRPEQSRRVEIFLPAAPARPGRKNPPDSRGCGVPPGALQRGVKFEAELQAEYQAELAAELQADFEAPSPPRRTRRQTVRPRLCLFQNDLTSRPHFHHQADRWARRIAAQASPAPGSCPGRVGATSYDTAADIISAISAAHSCQGRRLDAVHIFSHSGSNGVYGTTAGTAGLYISIDPASRAQGGREVADIPTAALAESVIFVLHGCNTANGTDNFARALYEHLAASLSDPKVFGHSTGACAGWDKDWREYSKRSPTGKVRLRTLKPRYEGNGGCDPAPKKP